VYLARDAPIGVVLRRGPSAWARLSLWHTDSDRFEHGQWFKGRVYERRCDLSADGSLFVYFARKTDGRTLANHARDSWVAISRPPWFTALALWFVGGTYYTGAYFPGERSLWLGFTSIAPDEGSLPGWLKVIGTPPQYIDRTNEWTNRTVYVNRLLRDGWQRSERGPDERWERRRPGLPLTLIMTGMTSDHAVQGARHQAEYAVQAEPGAEITPLGRCTWADLDRRGRLVLARDGRLVAWHPSRALEEIAGFNEQSPEPGPAPARARTWPRRPRGG
jgi:hypothetical protein